MAKLELKQIRKTYSNQTDVIKSIDLEIQSGEFIVFVGPSGCGKSTMLRMIAGLEDISSGEMLIDGVVVNDKTPSQRGIGMVFQSYALYPHMNVFENMAFALELANVNKVEIEKKVHEVAKILQLEELLHRKPKDLSGGQRQRVAIGRAIVREPKLFLFDEPLSNLDASLRVQMRMEIALLHQRLGTTIIYVTHDQVEAMTLANRIVVLNKGHIEQVGTPLELYDNPINEFVAQFIGSPQMNMIPCHLAQSEGDTSLVNLTPKQSLLLPIKTNTQELGQEIKLGIRPEHIICHLFSPPEHSIPAKVQFVEQMGNETYVHFCLDDNLQTLVGRIEERTLLSAGDRIYVEFPINKVHLFSQAGQSYSYHS